ncbi:AAA family ATPase [Gemmata sp. G18]|uniref:AAA family ATPase n=1 Tax=Gemmata palustris TaxID=2822762 RepID=A0ABS5C0R6_9BACT|nr:AAA family ATPase [Gemmata palustris]MBP3959579.1 AAA family ATPase [Gemmata palustris]
MARPGGALDRAEQKIRADAPVLHAGEMLVESLAGVRPRAVRWLVPGRIPAGMVGLLAGDGGHGKSVTTLELAAAVTRGRCAFGMTYPNAVSGKALLICCEDDWQCTVVPRLAALGADLSRVLRVKGIGKTDGGLLDFNLAHFAELERLLTRDKDIKLVVIDPAGAYIGRAGVDDNSDSELRSLLGPLSEAANRTGAAVLLVKHLNKSAGATAVQRVGGSVGYVNGVRYVYMIVPDPDDADRKLMLPIKANILPPGALGFAYRLRQLAPDEAGRLLLAEWPDLDAEEVVKLAAQLFRQEWEQDVRADPNAVASTSTRPRQKTPEQAAEWLVSVFNEEHVAYPSSVVFTAGKAAGFGRDSIYKAKDLAGLTASKSGRCAGTWYWGTGGTDLWLLREAFPSGSSGSSGSRPEVPEKQGYSTS